MIEIKITTPKETMSFSGTTTINAYNRMLKSFDWENTDEPVVLEQYLDDVLYERVVRNGAI